MSLLEKANILNMYTKKKKKSIYKPERKDLVLILSILILIISPFIINFILGLNSKLRQIDLFLSPRCEDFFGIEITENLMRDFQEQNPDLQISLLNPEEFSAETRRNRGSRMDEKGRGSLIPQPDIIIFDEGDFSGLIDSGALLPLMPYIQSEGSIAVKDTELFAIPLVSFMDLLFYNIELLQTAGFDRPPKTRDEFIVYAKTVSGGNEAAGAAIGLSPGDNLSLSRDIFSWIWAAGSDFWLGADSRNVQGPVINTRPIIADIAFLGRLYREGALAPMSFSMTGEQRLEEFAQGKFAMMIASTRVIPALREKMGDNLFGITAIPGGETAGKYSIGISGLYAGISAESEHPDRAWAFLEFMAGQSLLFCAELKAVPGIVSDLISGDYANDDPFYSKARDIFYSSEIVSGFSGKAGAQEFEDAVREELYIFFEGSRTAQETANAIQRKWDEISAER